MPWPPSISPIFSLIFFLEVDENLPLATFEPFGFLHPLPVAEDENQRFQILGNYHHFQAARQVGSKAMSCQIFPASLPAATLLSLHVLFHQQTGKMSPVLQAWIASRAQSMLSEQEQMALLILMGIQPHRYKMTELMALLHLDPSALIALHRGLLTQKSAKQLAHLTPEDQKLTVRIISNYQLGGSKQQKLLEMVSELVLRENQSVATLLGTWLPNMSETENLPQRAQGLFDYLQERCFPETRAAENAFRALVRSLHPPERITIRHSLSFEDNSLEVQLRFENIEALRRNWQALQSLVL